MQNSFILTKNSLSLYCNGNLTVVPVTHELFNDTLSAANSGDWTKVKFFVDKINGVYEWSDGLLSLKNKRLFYKSLELQGSIVDAALRMAEAGLKPTNLEKFLDKLESNPSYTAVQELYDFLQTHCLTITPDGDFYAYKWVTDDYLDCHTRTNKHDIGKEFRMERNLVDDNRHNNCSKGFHFCSSKYTKFGTRLMLVSINPADVVSIPSDYNFAKGRTCAYKVVAELDPNTYGELADKNLEEMVVNG